MYFKSEISLMLSEKEFINKFENDNLPIWIEIKSIIIGIFKQENKHFKNKCKKCYFCWNVHDFSKYNYKGTLYSLAKTENILKIFWSYEVFFKYFSRYPLPHKQKKIMAECNQLPLKRIQFENMTRGKPDIFKFRIILTNVKKRHF